MSMRIGIDIDDTLVSTSESFDEVIKKYNINFSKKLHDKWTFNERKLIFSNYLEEILMSAKIKLNAKEVINYLSEKGYELFIITARNTKYSKNAEVATKSLIKNENLNIKEIYFDQVKKSDIAKQLKIDLMIDDNIDVYNNMKKEGIDCILFGDKIKTWNEVLEYIKEKEE